MSTSLNLVVYDNHELDGLDYDREEPLLCFQDGFICDEISEQNECFLEDADDFLDIVREVLSLAHSDVPEFDEALCDLDDEYPEYGFLITKDQFATMLFKVRDMAITIEGEDAMFDIGRIRDKLERFMVDTDWEMNTVYITQVIV